MSKHYKVTLIDDLDGTLASETIKFTSEGTSYEIDLTDEHAAESRAALAPWVAHARPKTRPWGGRPVDAPGTSRAIRRWANDHGVPCPVKGRVPQEVRDMYLAATVED